MVKFFAYFFSPFGCVGRGGWWLFQLLCVPYGFVIGAGLAIAGSKALTDMGVPSNQQSQYLSHATSQQIQELFKHATPMILNSPITWLVLLALPFVGWSSLVIEIKRWHDLGITGFFMLVRVIPAFLVFFQVPAANLISSGLGFALFVILGFFPAESMGSSYQFEVRSQQPKSPYRASAARGAPAGYPPQPAPQSNSGWGGFALGCLFSLFLFVAVIFAFILGQATHVPPRSKLPASTNADANPAPPPASSANVPAPAATPPQAAPPPGGSNDNIHQGDVHDSASPTFARDWVVANGEKLSGITHVTVAPGNQVTILYSNGGKNVDVSSLPQGFLDLWNITPAALQAANPPAPNQP